MCGAGLIWLINFSETPKAECSFPSGLLFVGLKITEYCRSIIWKRFNTITMGSHVPTLSQYIRKLGVSGSKFDSIRPCLLLQGSNIMINNLLMILKEAYLSNHVIFCLWVFERTERQTPKWPTSLICSVLFSLTVFSNDLKSLAPTICVLWIVCLLWKIQVYLLLYYPKQRSPSDQLVQCLVLEQVHPIILYDKIPKVLWCAPGQWCFS